MDFPACERCDRVDPLFYIFCHPELCSQCDRDLHFRIGGYPFGKMMQRIIEPPQTMQEADKLLEELG